MEQILVYMTAPDAELARRIARELLVKRLAACVNILPKGQSLYWWQEEIQDEEEVVFLAKTQRRLFPALEACVRAVHPYETPCIVAVNLACGHAPFLDWISAQVAAGDGNVDDTTASEH